MTNDECLICGAPLEYLTQDTMMECVRCSGPCMWQNGFDIIFSRISIGLREVSCKHITMMESIPFVWQSLQT